MEEKESTIDVIKRYVEVNDGAENEKLRYLGEVWTERQRKEINVSDLKITIIPESDLYHS